MRRARHALRARRSAVDEDRLIARGPQRDVQDGALLADVDLLAANIASRRAATPRALHELDQEAEGLIGDAVLGIVEMEPDGLDGEPLAAPRIGGEQRPQMLALLPLEMRLERFPFR